MTDFKYISKIAKEAKYCMNDLDTNKKNEVLRAVAENLVADSKIILEANDKDMEKAVASGMNEGRLDRLKLTDARIEAMAEGVRQVADLEDPVGRILDTHTHANGMKITKISTPFGIVGIIYENRPNVTADAWALTFKAGNVVILKGAGDALNSNMAITDCIQRTLKECNVDENAIILIKDTDRAVTTEFMKQKSFVDVLIPRGGAGLIKSVVENSLIPVIETGTGNCHIFVDESADIPMALEIITNAKTQRVGVCNAAESLLVHHAIADAFLPALADKLGKTVELRGDEIACGIAPIMKRATEEDWGTEYLDYILSVKIVDSVDEAIAHTNRYHTGHSDAIITSSEENAEKFLNEVDSACVYANVSTRFTDGFMFGFGAEIGISTQKLHARGPMGLKELTSYKYQLRGNGQVRG